MYIEKDELNTIRSLPMVMAPCEFCNTTGEVDGEDCDECNGRGIRVYENNH